MPFTLNKFASKVLPALPTGVQDLVLVKAEYKPNNQSIKVYFNHPAHDGVASDNFTNTPKTEWVLGEWMKRLELPVKSNLKFGTEDKMFQYVTDLINAMKGSLVTVKVSEADISPTLLNAQIIRLAEGNPAPSPATISDDEDVAF